MRWARRRLGIILVVGLVLGGLAFWRHGRAVWVPIYLELIGKRTVADVLVEYGPVAGARLRDRFRVAGVSFPPGEIALVGLKEERLLELWARTNGHWVRVHRYEVLAASGQLGPKLREGDRQVPEGVYGIEGLNPNSRYHLSLKVSYPNDFDRQQAAAEGRAELGGDIFIHGKDRSIGCLAMGDDAIEELFILVAEVGAAHTRVVLAPRDLRSKPLPDGDTPWVRELHSQLREELSRYVSTR